MSGVIITCMLLNSQRAVWAKHNRWLNLLAYLKCPFKLQCWVEKQSSMLIWFGLGVFWFFFNNSLHNANTLSRYCCFHIDILKLTIRKDQPPKTFQNCWSPDLSVLIINYSLCSKHMCSIPFYGAFSTQIPRYILTLHELLAHTPHEHVERNSLEYAKSKLEELSRYKACVPLTGI